MSQYKPYPAYKDSGVEWLGQVPEHWDVLPLRAVASVNDDEREASSDLDEKIRYVDISTVSLEAGIGEPAVIPVQEAPSRAQRKAKVGDVVLSTVRTYLRAIGQVHKEHEDCIFSTGFSVIRAGTKLNPSFLYASILSEPFLAEIEANSKGVSYPAINASEVMFFKLPLPPKEEQEHIATVLAKETTRIDALVAKKTRFIELLREKRQALITHAVTKGLDPNVKMKDSGVEWLGEVPEHWNILKVGRHVKVITGFAFPSSGFSQNPEHQRLLRGVNVGVSSLRWDETAYWERREGDGLDAFELKAGSLVLGMDRPWISEGLRIALLEEKDLPCLLLQRVASLEPDSGILKKFLYLILSSDVFKVALMPDMTGLSVPHISSEQISRFLVALPAVHEQENICTYVERELSRISFLVRKIEQSIELLKERRSALITAAVTGQIDLRESA